MCDVSEGRDHLEVGLGHALEACLTGVSDPPAVEVVLRLFLLEFQLGLRKKRGPCLLSCTGEWVLMQWVLRGLDCPTD